MRSAQPPLRRARTRALCRHATTAAIESLESRTLLANVAVNVGNVVRPVDTKWLGINTAPWDGQMHTAATNTLVNAIGTAAVRMGGGSYVDDTWHFNVNNQNQTMGAQANFVASRNAVGMVTVNYGSGSPQEAAALLAYLNGSTSNTTNIGIGQQWSTSSNAWVNVNWQTAGYWAGLRAAAPIAGNPDGLNFLRLNRPQPYGFKYWDVGNEVYGSWETDHHGHATDQLPMPPGGVRAAHDPTTFVSFAKQFQLLANQIDPTISMGFDSQNTDPTQFSNWTARVLQEASDADQNWNIGFVSDHLYMQDAGQENDTFLLNTIGLPATPTPANPKNWGQRAVKYRNLITNNYTPAEGAGVEILATEHNSISGSPRRQTTNLPNGIFLADSIGAIMQTEYNGLFMWDLHNSWAATTQPTTVYGWRNGSDYGIIGVGNITSLPATGLNVPYPTYFAEQIASKIVKTGGSVVQATSDDTSLGVYAVKQADGKLTLMIINRSKNGLNNNTTGTPALNNTTFTINGFNPGTNATMWQYGSAEDNFAKNSANGLSSVTQTSPTLNVSASNQFTFSFPSLSMTVIEIPVGAPKVVGTEYDFETRPNRVRFTFDQDMLASSFAPSDLVLSTTNGVALPLFDSVAYDAPSKTATFTLENIIPADANYTATLPAGAVSSAGSVATTSPSSFTFFALAADANHDRHVDQLDQAIVTANFNQPGTFSDGDFNGDNVVNAADQSILNAQLQIWLPPDGTLALPSTSGSDVITLRRESSSLVAMFTNPSGTGTPAFRIYTTAATSFALDGGAGADTLRLDFGNGRPFPTNGIGFVGGVETDTLAIIGTSNVADTATFGFNGAIVNGAIAVPTGGVERISFDGRAGDDIVSVQAGQIVSFPASQHFASLTIGADSVASIDAGLNGVIVTRALSMNAGATLDLNDNSLIVDYIKASELEATQSRINTARNGGPWDGFGITSSTARDNAQHNTTLGAMESTDFKSIYGPAATFAGETIDTTAVLVKYTYYGDADFNGQVNFDDYARIDAGFLNTRTGWLNGDFDGNGSVNFDDYSLIDLAFNTQLGARSTGGSGKTIGRSGR